MASIDFFSITIKPATWQQDQQSLQGIRYAVFVDEQQVPIEIEIDDQDPVARHWLAFDPQGNAIGTARLENSGKVGRMAVLKEFRGRGVGAALLRRIILDASSQGMDSLYLHAQVQAIPFYQEFGFVGDDKEFDEGGIPHITMHLDLGPYRYRAMTSATVATHLDGLDAIAEAIGRTAADCRRIIRIYSEQFNNDLLANQQVVEALQQFLTRSGESRVALMVRDIEPDSGPLQPLLSLQRRLNSRFEIRQCDDREQLPAPEFVVLFDDGQLIQSINGQEGAAQLLQQAPAEVRQHAQLFDELWQRSPVPIEVRQLNISG